MKLKHLILTLAGVALLPVSAGATTLSLQFSFQDANGLVTGDGLFNATPVFNDPGAFLATSGDLSISAPTADGISGDYQLFPNPNGTNATSSPTGMFIYDDLILPGGNPIVTNPGLLGFGGSGPGSVPEGQGQELNFFSSGANTYDLYTSANGGYPYSYVFTVPPGTASASTAAAPAVTASSVRWGIHGGGPSLVAAPEPSTWIIMGSFLLIGLARARSMKPAASQD